MDLVLGPELQKLIDARVQSGVYPTAEAVVAAAIVALDQQERFGDFASGELDALLQEGERSIVDGGLLDGDTAFHCRQQRRAAASGQSG